jgi:opacity protein-like surface antigen
MKKIALLSAFAVLFLCAACAKKADVPVKILTINDIKSDPFSFPGEITINGITSAFSENDKTYFTVMDTAELMVCRNLYCGAYALPAKYTGNGQLPELADMVDITGRFVKNDDGFYFAVTSFEVKRNIMNILTSKLQ